MGSKTGFFGRFEKVKDEKAQDSNSKLTKITQKTQGLIKFQIFTCREAARSCRTVGQKKKERD